MEHDESLLETADTVVIATQEPTPDLLATGTLPEDVTAVLKGIGPRTRIVSLCTSAFLLAAAGLLDGMRATTHWTLCEAFTQLFPGIEVDPNVLFVDNGRILTSAAARPASTCACTSSGWTTGRVSRRRPRGGAWRRRGVRAGRRSSSSTWCPRTPTDRSTSDTRQWALERLAEPLTLEDMARHAHMSVRTFTRRFRQETGLSPLKWLAQRRLAHARHLLESTTLPVARIATACGFGDPVALRRQFHTHVGLSPAAYRRAHSAPGVAEGAAAVR